MQILVNGADISASYTGQELEDISVELIAFDGEAGQGTLPHPDAAGAGEWYAGQSCKVQDGSGPATVIVDGFVGDQERERGEAARTRRLETFHLEDPNALLSGRRAIGWARPTETDRARVLAFAAAYVPTLSTTQVLNTNTATLPAKTYTTEDLFPDLLADVREATGKTIYVVDRDLHSHLTTEGPAATISLTDGTANYSTTWPVYEPHRTKDKGELANDVTARNQGGSTANAQDATSISRHDSGGLKHQAFLDLADVATASLAGLAAAHLAQHKDERKTYQVTTGPFTPAQTALVKPGMLIVVTSQAIGLSAATERIGRMTWQYKHPGSWWAVLELSHPLRVRTTSRASHDVPTTQRAASVVAGTGGACTGTPEPHTVSRRLSSSGVYSESVSGIVAATSEFGSWVYDNQAYTVVGCPVGGGGWSGYHDQDLWFQFTAPADTASYLGLLVTVDASAITKTVYTAGWEVRIHPAAPAAALFGRGTSIAVGPESGSTTIYIPRSAVTWGAINSLIFHPSWLCARAGFTCNAASYFGNPHDDGRLQSGAYANLGISVLCAAIFAPGTTGMAPGVAGIGAVDGLNRLFTLVSWTGAGPVGVTINGLEQPTGGMVLTATTATLATPPPSGSIVLFTYPVSA